MTTPDSPTNHELMASDAYWNDAILPMEARFGVQWTSSPPGQAKAIAGLALGLEKAFSAEPIPESETIAQPTEGTKKLIRVVQDTRWLSPATLKTVPSSQELEDFEDRIDEMSDQGLYMGPGARTWTAYSYWRSARVRRDVHYLNYYAGEKYLHGLSSASFIKYAKSGDPSKIGLVVVARPKLVVGQVYSRGIIRNGLTKVVAADILEPGGRFKRRPSKFKPPTNRRKPALPKSLERAMVPSSVMSLEV